MSKAIQNADYRPQFPNLSSSNHVLTSNPTQSYNCIAWAANDAGRWWEPNLPFDAGYYWPSDAKPDYEPDSLASAFHSIGYKKCKDSSLEVGYEKVALYSKEGRWTHAARQLEDGRWTSKLGRAHDITHDTPDVVNGDIYGQVFCFMRRHT